MILICDVIQNNIIFHLTVSKRCSFKAFDLCLSKNGNAKCLSSVEQINTCIFIGFWKAVKI